MTRSRTPSGHESMGSPDEDLPARILDRVTGLTHREEPGLSRETLTELTVLDATVDGNERWDFVYGEVGRTIASLSDPRLQDSITTELVPQRVFWWSDEGRPVETTLIHFNETFSLAYEVSLDEQGNPWDVETVLWHGDQEDVEDFLMENQVSPVGTEYVPDGNTEDIQVASPAGPKAEHTMNVSPDFSSRTPDLDLERLDQMIEKLETLQGNRNRHQRKALLLVLHTLRAVALLELDLASNASHPDEVSPDDFDYAAEEPPTYYYAPPRKRKKPKKYPDVTKRHPGGVHNGFIPPVVRARNYPIRQPRPHNGNRWGGKLG